MAEFSEILEIQENKCMICKIFFTEKEPPCVDHCHDTKDVRSLLCRSCNLALGYLKDDPKLCFFGRDIFRYSQKFILDKAKKQ